ncbi:MAG: AcrR family transcriptional regulator [Myxococcota bacterium]|jgi:AcrR family transcriptional regulator
MNRRDQLIDAAEALFLDRGFRATGVDTILSRAGVAKMTLYNHFGSKETLVREVLDRLDHDVKVSVREAIEEGADNHEERLVRAFDRLVRLSSAPSFKAAPFIRAAAEDSDATPYLLQLAQRHHRDLLELLADEAADAGVADPDALAEALLILVGGVTVQVSMAPTERTLSLGQEMARNLVHGALAH